MERCFFSDFDGQFTTAHFTIYFSIRRQRCGWMAVKTVGLSAWQTAVRRWC